MNLHELGVTDIVALIAREDRAVLDAMAAAQSALARFIEAVEPGFAAGGRLIYLGAGTSGRLGVLDASEAPPTFAVPPGRIIGIIAGGDGALRISSEGKEDDADGARAELESLNITGNDAVLGIAAGGTTPYPRGALAIARQMAPGCVTGLLCCSPVEPPPHCDHLIVLLTGAEVLTGSTRMKAGTATKLALNTISTALMIRTGRVFQNLMVDVRASNIKLRDRAARIIASATGLSREESFAALDEADGQAKLAIVMVKIGCDRAEAQRRLHASGGRLDSAINA